MAYWWFLIQNFSEIKPALRQLMEVGKETADPRWMHCVPLWHFLTGKCKPFDKLPQDNKHAAIIPTWWGIADFEAEIRYTKGKSDWKVYVFCNILNSQISIIQFQIGFSCLNLDVVRVSIINVNTYLIIVLGPFQQH